MPEFLRTQFANELSPDPQAVALRLVAAVVFGAGVAWVYRRARGQHDIAPTFPVTLVLLSVLIAMVTQVIGDNVARAFSLVGALSIVRFRTIVRDTQDTAYVIFAVVVGMAVGAGHLVVGAIGIVVVSLAAFLMRSKALAPAAAGEAPFEVRLRLGLGHDIESVVGKTLDGFLAGRRLLSISTAKQGLSLDVAYEGELRTDGTEETLVKSLNRTEGVQSVELVRRTTLQD